MNILDTIIAFKRREVALRKAECPFGVLSKRAESLCGSVMSGRSFRSALLHSDSGIIAEFKRKSPSRGFIKRDAEVSVIAEGYARSGASAMSVLTDGPFFGGTLEDLRMARRTVDLPLLRKDFIVDEYQVFEAKVAGADAILLIAAALSPGEVQGLARTARELGLEVLLEIHREEELDHLCKEADVVGINNRDLTTFVTDTARSLQLAERIPARFVKISESGISVPETVKELRKAGFRGFLMGENFMKEPDPAAALKNFIGAL